MLESNHKIENKFENRKDSKVQKHKDTFNSILMVYY